MAEENIIKDSQWIEWATTFSLGECRIYGRPVEITRRLQLDDSVKWIVKMHEWCLGTDGEFHYEPLPSSRTDEFIALTRFDSKEEAYEAWVNLVKKEKPLYYD